MVPEIYTTTSRQFCSFYTGFLYMSVLNSRSCCLPPSIFEKKMVLVWGRSEPRRCCQPPTLPLNYAEKMRETIFPKSRVHIKDNNNSPHGKLHQFLFPFSDKFLDLNFVPFVLYIYLCYMKSVRDTNSEPGLPVIWSGNHRFLLSFQRRHAGMNTLLFDTPHAIFSWPNC